MNELLKHKKKGKETDFMNSANNNAKNTPQRIPRFKKNDYFN